MTAINVVVVEDHHVVAEGLKLILDSVEEINVQGVAGTGQQAIQLAQTFKPDVILTDLRLPGMHGVELISAIAEELPATRFIVLTNYDEDHDIFQAIEAGATGYLLKTCSKRELVEAITAVNNGETKLSPSVLKRVVDRLSSGGPSLADRPTLTTRELEILQNMAFGFSNKEIASRLTISENTIKTHVARIFEKMDVRDRTQAVAYGIRDRMIKV